MYADIGTSIKNSVFNWHVVGIEVYFFNFFFGSEGGGVLPQIYRGIQMIYEQGKGFFFNIYMRNTVVGDIEKILTQVM